MYLFWSSNIKHQEGMKTPFTVSYSKWNNLVFQFLYIHVIFISVCWQCMLFQQLLLITVMRQNYSDKIAIITSSLSGNNCVTSKLNVLLLTKCLKFTKTMLQIDNAAVHTTLCRIKEEKEWFMLEIRSQLWKFQVWTSHNGESHVSR